MIRLLIIKELKQIIFSNLYWFLFAIVLLLNISITFVLIEQYNHNLSEYNEYRIETKKLLKSGSFAENIYYQPVKPPANLNVLFNGIKQFQGKPTLEKNSISYLFSEKDFFFIIGFLMSFIALIFSFRSIAGENEDGTLKLLFCYPIKRNSIILGKWLGGLIATFIPLLISFVISIIMILLRANLQWSFNDSLAILFIIILSLIYVSLFHLIGIYISIKSKNSTKSSMIKSIFIWSIIVLILPTIPDYIGKVISPTPTASELIYHTQIKPKQKRQQYKHMLKQKYRNKNYSQNIKDSIIQKKLTKLNNKIDENKQKYINHFDKKIQGQMISSISFAIISPYSSLIISGNEIAATGITSSMHFQKQRQKFTDKLNSYFQNKEKKSNITRPNFKYKEMPLKPRIIPSLLPFISIIIFHIIFNIKSVKAIRQLRL